MSANFLVQILNDMRRAGLVESRRGMGGGYLLARNPETITLRQIVEAVDPTLLQASVSNSGESGAAVANAWRRVGENVVASLDAVTLANISEAPAEPMFHI